MESASTRTSTASAIAGATCAPRRRTRPRCVYATGCPGGTGASTTICWSHLVRTSATRPRRGPVAVRSTTSARAPAPRARAAHRDDFARPAGAIEAARLVALEVPGGQYGEDQRERIDEENREHRAAQIAEHDAQEADGVGTECQADEGDDQQIGGGRRPAHAW